MDVFQTHSRIVSDYENYIRSFLKIADPEIKNVVETELAKGKLWPEPLLQFNPPFEIAGTVAQAPTLRWSISRLEATSWTLPSSRSWNPHQTATDFPVPLQVPCSRASPKIFLGEHREARTQFSLRRH
jgi:hypothetical protein